MYKLGRGLHIGEGQFALTFKNNVRLYNETIAYIQNTCNNAFRFSIIKLYINLIN